MVYPTAAELWKAWLNAGVVRPEDYDRDLADAIRQHLGPSRTRDLARAMHRVEWTPRDLLRAIFPELQSFSGMLRDLLGLYAKVEAQSASHENLRIVYEFDEHDPFDLLLSSFREQAESASRVVTSGGGVGFPADHAFDSPARKFGDWDRIAAIFGERPDDWPFTKGAPRCAPTGNPDADAVIARGLRVVDSVMAVLARFGATRGAVTAWRDVQGVERTIAADMAQAAHDYWPLMTTASLHGLADAVRRGSVELGVLTELDRWLDRFESAAEMEQAVTEVTDLLTLPTWGKRHELYSAWVSTQIDAALAVDRATFHVKDGVLAFPFKATLLADVMATGGPYELWCEMRTDLVDQSSLERVGGIQPDYRIVRRDPYGRMTTVLAIEVKQYRRGAAGRHGAVLAKYAAGLPEATVVLVGHGPLGRTVRDRVPSADRSRTSVFENVRPDRPNEAESFRTEIERLLPEDSTRTDIPSEIELRWDPRVYDLDLHVRFSSGAIASWQNLATPHGFLEGDAYGGGPEVVRIFPESLPPIEVVAKLYSNDVATITEAKPEVIARWSDGRAQTYRPRGRTAEEREWRVCRFEIGGVVSALESSIDSGRLEIPPSPPPRAG